MKTLTLALLGYGTVGKGFVKALETARPQLLEKYGVTLRLKTILVNHKDKHSGLSEEGYHLVSDFKEVLLDPEVGVVVEAISGANPAAIYLTSALAKGKHVITANKAALATSWHVLHRAAAKSGARLYYEASVAAGIPIIETLKDLSLADEILSVSGIVNGTTNYILTEMAEQGITYESALMKAQALGYAEANPAADVDGQDAANKLSILCSICFSRHIPPEAIKKASIRQLPYAMRGLKLVAMAEMTNSGLSAAVELRQLGPEHPLHHVTGVENAIIVNTKGLGQIKLYGPGAGQSATGTAMVKDLSILLQHINL